VQVPAGRHPLEGNHAVPAEARGVVLFADGSGSGRRSPRNQFVAAVLQAAGVATLLIDLLEAEEAEDGDHVFDISLLAGRLAGGAGWLIEEPATRDLPLGLFGANTGAAVAPITAARLPGAVAAVVSLGGRPDLAWGELPSLRAPTLLIVGGDDDPMLGLNERALGRLRCRKEMAVIPEATHLFKEPGALEEVARLAAAWFSRQLAPAASASALGPWEYW
jgi:pimeloyl-ACP methyl ester carboxylesterase